MTNFELYKLLESNNYKTTEKNLSILKEGVAAGNIFIEENEIITQKELDLVAKQLEETVMTVSEYGESMLEGLDEDDLSLFITVLENTTNFNLNEATLTTQDPYYKTYFIVNEAMGRKQREAVQSINNARTSSAAEQARSADAHAAMLKKADADDARAKATKQDAKKKWSFGAATKNFFGRVAARVSRNKQKYEDLHRERAAGLKAKSEGLSQAAKLHHNATIRRSTAGKLLAKKNAQSQAVENNRVNNGNKELEKRNKASIATRKSQIAAKAQEGGKLSIEKMRDTVNKADTTATNMANKHKAEQKTISKEEAAAKAKSLKESYSDYELYKLLNENKYATTEKNLSVLKEGVEAGNIFIEENEIITQKELDSLAQQLEETVMAISEYGKSMLEGLNEDGLSLFITVLENTKGFNLNEATLTTQDPYYKAYFIVNEAMGNDARTALLKKADDLEAKSRDTRRDAEKKWSVGARTKYLFSHYGATLTGNKKKIQDLRRDRSTMKLAKAEGMAQAAKLRHEAEVRRAAAERTEFDPPVTSWKAGKTTAKANAKAAKLKESYSDYELYKLLDESNYATTKENLAILKEGLASGEIVID